MQVVLGGVEKSEKMPQKVWRRQLPPRKVDRQEGTTVCFQELRRPKWVQHSFAPEELPILQLKNIKATGNMILVWDFDVKMQGVVILRVISVSVSLSLFLFLSPCLPVSIFHLYLSPCLLLPPPLRKFVPAFRKCHDLPLWCCWCSNMQLPSFSPTTGQCPSCRFAWDSSLRAAGLCCGCSQTVFDLAGHSVDRPPRRPQG